MEAVNIEEFDENTPLSGEGSGYVKLPRLMYEKMREKARKYDQEHGSGSSSGSEDEDVEYRCGREAWQCRQMSAWLEERGDPHLKDYADSWTNTEPIVEQQQPQFLIATYPNERETYWQNEYSQLMDAYQNQENYWRSHYERKHGELNNMKEMYNRLLTDFIQLKSDNEQLGEAQNSSELTEADLTSKLDVANQAVALLSVQLEEAIGQKNFLLTSNIELSRIMTMKKSTVSTASQATVTTMNNGTMTEIDMGNYSMDNDTPKMMVMDELIEAPIDEIPIVIIEDEISQKTTENDTNDDSSLHGDSIAKMSHSITENDENEKLIDVDPSDKENLVDLELMAENGDANMAMKSSDSGVSNVTSSDDEDEGDEQHKQPKKKKSKARKQKERKNKKAQAKKSKSKNKKR